MEHIDLDTDAPEETGARRRGPLRWVLRGMFVVCGALMAMVLLSEPAVRSKVESGTAWLSDLIAPEADVAMMDTDTVPPAPAIPQVAEPEPRAIPQVSTMPTSRIPVRRGSIARER